MGQSSARLTFPSCPFGRTTFDGVRMSTLAARMRNLGRVPVKWIVLAAYVLLVLVSRWVTSADRQPKAALAHTIELAQVGPAGAAGALPIVVLPSLPARGEQDWRRTFLDGRSAGLGPVYAVRWPTAHHRSRASMGDDALAADLLLALETRFGKGRFHLIGEGMGGAVALSLAHRHPGRVASLTFVSAPGAQEYTLLGNAVANKFVYFFHHIPFVLFDVATPHFGLADRLPYNRGYSGVFFDSDLSDAKSMLRAWNGPALLVHGKSDWIAPVDAARYSVKLMPQARLLELEGGHGEEIADVAAPQVAEFIAAVKAKPGFTYGTPGIGTIGHLAGALFAQDAGLGFTHVPYRGGGPAVIDLVAGHIQALFVTLPAAIEHIRAGRLRALAVTSAGRSAALPEVPSVAESGFPEFEVITWQGILAPAQTPPAAIRRLAGALDRILAKPEVSEQLTAQGFEVSSQGPAQFAHLIQAEARRWPGLVRRTGAQPD